MKIIKKYNSRLVPSLLASMLVVATVFASQPRSSAQSVSDLQNQKNILQSQINSTNSTLQGLTNKANTLQNEVAILNAQIADMQNQIATTKNKITSLQSSLDQAQANLEKQKTVLQASIEMLYKNEGASTIELIVGSDSFSKFIDSQTYLQSLKDGITTSVKKIQALKQQIQTQQDEQKKLLNQQQAQQNSLQATQAQQQSLLDQTQGSEANYQQIVAGLRAQQQSVIAAIAAKMAASGTTIYTGDGSNGGYPTVWANAEQDSLVDSWGMWNRECVSYAAFKVAQSGRYMPAWGRGYLANAQNWPGLADAFGIPTDRSPRVGDVAITYNYPVGHAMYVEAVNGRMVTISQYNWPVNGQWGMWSEMTLSADSSSLGPMTFIHF